MSTRTLQADAKLRTTCAYALKKTARKTPGSWNAIYKAVKQIPRGCVITYGGVAKRMRLRGGARVVGYAMAASPSGSGVPWHRVIGAGGHLRLREPLVSLQRKLLESEGVTFIEQRVDIEKHLWNAQKNRKSARTNARKSGRSSHL
jgi:methylated-DNA-protein-cysteine methyltransferase-like protein